MAEIRHKANTILSKNFKKGYSMRPIGHHELGRHFVYCVSDNLGGEYILKIYGRQDRWCLESNALDILKDNFFCPKIINKGKLVDGTGWILMEKMPGVVLDTVWKDMTFENKKQIIGEMGEYLGIIHSNSTYCYYGPWPECGGDIANFKDFMEYRYNIDNKIVNDLIMRSLPEKGLLIDSYNAMVKYYEQIKVHVVPRLCHHDFSGRNIIVLEENKGWRISGIIDYEHCYPDDPNIDLANLFHRIFVDEPKLTKHFLNRYTKYMDLSPNFDDRIKYYLLNSSIQICTWAYEFAHDYYKECIRLLNILLKDIKK